MSRNDFLIHYINSAIDVINHIEKHCSMDVLSASELILKSLHSDIIFFYMYEYKDRKPDSIVVTMLRDSFIRYLMLITYDPYMSEKWHINNENVERINNYIFDIYNQLKDDTIDVEDLDGIITTIKLLL